MNRFLLQQFELGPMENFVYFLGDANAREVFVVDPAWEVDTIFRNAERSDLTIVGALLTHHHRDHTNGIEELLQRKEVPVYVHKRDLEFVNAPASALTPVDHHEKIKAGRVEIEFLHTPGHTPGSQCFRIENSLVTGDTLFIDGCGRCDLPGGDASQMYYTLTQRLMTLPEETLLYPGHNYGRVSHDTLSMQKQTNPFLRMASLSLKDFLKLRIGKKL